MKAADLPRYYNAVDILECNLPGRRDKIALYSRARELTFQAVADEVNQIGNGLKRLDVRLGEYVAILAPDCAEWATSFFGVIKVGAIAVCLNTMLQPQEYATILRDCRPRVLIVHESLLGALAALRHQLPTLAQVIVLGQPQGADELAFAAWIAGESTSLVAAETHRDDFCTLHYSSGTTGEPKGVLHAHKDYALIAQLSGIDLFGIGEDDRTFATAKLFFTYGLGGNLIFPWAVGASTVLYDGSARLPNPILEIIAQFRPTIFYSVPTNYLTLLSVNNFAQTYNLSSLRLCLSAGEALPVAVWQKWQAQTNLEILDTIGCTETLHTFLANRPDALRPGSSGKPFAGYEVKLEDEEGRAVPTGEIGNLLVRAESVALSYLHQYEKSRHTFRGEWLFTGDRYYRDEAGFYWHAGRSDELFKVGGLWVSPVEVEAVLASHPAVLACGVVGQAEQSELIKPKAFVQLQPDYAPSPDLVRDLLRHCGAQLAAHKCPRWIEFVEELPRTATGKLQRFKLRGAG